MGGYLLLSTSRGQAAPSPTASAQTATLPPICTSRAKIGSTHPNLETGRRHYIRSTTPSNGSRFRTHRSHRIYTHCSQRQYVPSSPTQPPPTVILGEAGTAPSDSTASSLVSLSSSHIQQTRWAGSAEMGFQWILNGQLSPCQSIMITPQKQHNAISRASKGK